MMGVATAVFALAAGDAMAASSLYVLNTPSYGVLSFGQLDPATGVITPAASFPNWLSPSLNLYPNNPIAGEYFFNAEQFSTGYSAPGTFEIAGATATGSVRAFANSTTVLGFDTATDMLIASSVDASGNHLVAINPTTLATTVLSNSYAGAGQLFVIGSAAVNSVDRELYRLGTGNTLFVVDLDTGALKRSIALSNGIAGALAWDGVNGKLYDLTNPASGDFRLASVNTITGAVTTLSSASVSSTLSNEGRSLDVLDGIFYLQTSSGVSAVDINTGNLIGSTAANFIAIFQQDPVILGGAKDSQFDFSITNVNTSLFKVGTGATVLSGQSVYSGATTVVAGTLNVTGSIASSAVTVQSGATLSGTGTVGATTVNSGGTLALAGDGATATLSVNGNLVLASGAATAMEVNSTASDKVAVTGTANLDGALFAIFAAGQSYSAAQYALVSSTGTLSGSFAGFNTSGLSGTGYHATLSYDAHDAYLNLIRDTFIWSSAPAGSDWNSNADWQNGAVPVASDVAVFDATGNAAITVSQAATAKSLQFNAGASAYSFAVTGSASGAASLALTDGGIVNNSSSAPSFAVSGLSGNGGALIFSGTGNATNASITAGAFGIVTFNDRTDAGANAALVAQSGGTISFAGTGPANDNKVSAGSIAGAGTFDLGGNSLTVGALNTSTEVSGSITGTGGLTKTGSGTLTLAGNNSFTGGTTVSSGTLQIGNGGTAGSIVGNVVDNGLLIFNRADAVSYAGVISGTGGVTKLAGGVLTLSGASSYSGATTVSAGTLNITGAIASSATTVASGASLTGTGSLGALTVQSGGTVSPGVGGVGTLTVAGNLALNSGDTFALDLSPSTADRISAGGAATISGALVVTAASGTYVPGSYTIVSAAGGLTGIFSSFTISGIPNSVKGRIAYDAHDAYLVLDPNAITPLLPSGTSAIDAGVAAAIDNAIKNGATLPAAFQALFGLSGSQLTAALDQIAGKGAADTGTAASQGLSSFLLLLQGQGGGGSFAPGVSYNMADAPRPAQLGAGATRVWGEAFGGHAGISGNAAAGTASLSSTNYGFAAGAEVGATPDLVLGASIGIGRQNFRAAGGAGDSDDVMIGGYARQTVADHGYVAGALGYGWHTITTSRSVTVSGTDVLGAKYDADDLGWRVEGGWQVPAGAVDLTPFLAVAGDKFDAPAYSESAISGSSAFALSYASVSTSQAQSELGLQIDHGFAAQNGTLSASFRSAWAHQLSDAPLVAASFQTLPGSSFQLAGVRAATDTAILDAGLNWQREDGLAASVRLASQLGAGTTIVEGMGTIGWHW